MQLLDLGSPSLFETLEDIARNIQIQAPFTIVHPQYQPLELTDAIANSLQQLPSDTQNRYLNLQLRTFIHGIYYSGILKSVISEDTGTVTLENNTIRGIDRNYYSGLESNNSGKGFYETGWQVIGQENDELLVVQKNGLTLHVANLKEYSNAQINDTIAVLMPKNRLEYGYYIAVGDAGFVNMCGATQAVDIYFHFTARSAIAVMKSLTQQLNAIAIPFTFKVVYDPVECEHRNDAGILNIESRYYSEVHPILQQIYHEHSADFCPDIPLFTKYLAPGLSLAEAPQHQFIAGETFGMNRCRIVANALLAAYQSNEDTAQTRIAQIQNYFAQMNISLQYPYLNPDSQDIYNRIT